MRKKWKRNKVRGSGVKGKNELIFTSLLFSPVFLFGKLHCGKTSFGAFFLFYDKQNSMNARKRLKGILFVCRNKIV